MLACSKWSGPHMLTAGLWSQPQVAMRGSPTPQSTQQISPRGCPITRTLAELLSRTRRITPVLSPRLSQARPPTFMSRVLFLSSSKLFSAPPQIPTLDGMSQLRGTWGLGSQRSCPVWFCDKPTKPSRSLDSLARIPRMKPTVILRQTRPLLDTGGHLHIYPGRLHDPPSLMDYVSLLEKFRTPRWGHT
jgi:hypothetical protein